MNIRLVGAVAAAVAALGVAGCGSSSSSSSASSTSTPTTSAGTTTAPATTGGSTTAPATTGASTTAAIDAKALFLNGKSSTNAMACAGCHVLKAAGAAGTAGPSLDELATDDNAAAIKTMITDPNGEIVDGYQKNVMPQDYAKSLTPAEISALATYIDKNSLHAEK
ncbi:MAG: c-type cytochrome [Thermoleophilia bacterium]